MAGKKNAGSNKKLDSDLNVNWDRAIFIDDVIDEDLVNKLTPTILNLRQISDEPITVGINSPGGYTRSLDVLLGLVSGPSQTGKRGKIITVVTNQAYSSAANFLAFGDYAVALRHSKILYHDVRYGGLEDVTPEKARNAVKSLQDENDAFALRLANKIIRRLIWIYLDLHTQFDDSKKKFPVTLKRFQACVDAFLPEVEGKYRIDMAGFALCIFAKLSNENDGLITNVMDRLGRWIHLTNLANGVSKYREKGSRKYGMLDGARQLHKSLEGDQGCFDSAEDNLKLLMTLLVAETIDKKTSNTSFSIKLEKATRNLLLIESMNDKKHMRSAIKLMLENEIVFFGREIKEELKDKTEDEAFNIMAEGVPSAQLFWLFCVSLCRELFEGEHILQPYEAQLLGLIDEVAGGGPVQSKREWGEKQDKKEEK